MMLQDPDVKAGNAPNTIEFQWYSGEEGGLLGSRAIYQQYKKEGKDVRAMLQQDMTGYVQKTLRMGKKEVFLLHRFILPHYTVLTLARRSVLLPTLSIRL